VSKPSPPRVVQLTPPGRGAVATLLVEGPDALRLVESGFRPAGGRPLGSYPLSEIVFGHFAAGSHPAEQVVVCRRSEQSVELHCHGGEVAVARIRAALVDRGCRAVSWSDWVADHERDPIAAAARIALADARTERAAAVLLDQYHGALRRALDSVRQHLEAGDAAAAAHAIETLLGRAGVGRHLVQPWRVVLAGWPNVGKSSLINRLVGYPRAIVHATAGTTRDVVSALTAIDGWPVELSDTAGLRKAGHGLEQAAAELAREQVASADLVLWVFDLTEVWSDADEKLLLTRPDGLVVHNKCDLAPARGARREGLLTSALTGEGIDELVGEVAARLVPDPPPPRAPLPFSGDQIDGLERAAAAASQDDPAGALAALRML
jgi:tRNA modification GTPase